MDGIGGEAMASGPHRLREARADVFCVGAAAAIADGTVGIALLEDVPEEISPVLEILPFQRSPTISLLQEAAIPTPPAACAK